MSEDLIRVAKDGAQLDVHPSCLAAHQGVGWVVVEDAAEVVDEPAAGEFVPLLPVALAMAEHIARETPRRARARKA